MAKASEIIAKARSYIGVKESPVNSNNVIFNTDYYGKEVNGSAYPWCCAYVWDVYRMCNASNLFYGGKKTASCETSLQYDISQGLKVDTPQFGDRVYFQFDSDTPADHIGWVSGIISSTQFKSIEGNTSVGNDSNGGEVMERIRNISSVKAFTRPKYDPETEDKKEDNTMNFGIDVSSYQGTIDWAKVKANGCKFAILKIIRKDLNKDTSFEANVMGCDKNNIPWDVYNYSYASTVDKFISDANVVIKALNGRKCTVWLDIEDKVQKGIGQVLIDGINAYKKVIESNGCTFGVYTGLSFYNTNIKSYSTQLTCPFWIARYYKGDEQMEFGFIPNDSYKPNIANVLYGWQFTSKGKINGITGLIDMNITYATTPIPTPTQHKNLVTASSLNIRSSRDSSTKTNIVGSLKKNDEVIVYDAQDNWLKISNTKEQWVSANYVSSAYTGKVTANSLNVRDGENTTSVILKVLSKGETVKIYGKGASGWYITPYGFVSNKYIEIV